MIITKTPFRISFCGGGTDLAAFYEKAGYGAVVSTSIDKYIYLAVHRFFEDRYLLKYSSSELTETIDEIKHPLIRECLRFTKTTDFLEMTSFADIPSSGSGLGSSSSFCVGLIHALLAYRRRLPSRETCAAGACELEIGVLGEPIGKQDQYAAAYGGLNFIQFNANGSVCVQPLILPRETFATLQSRLCLFYTGVTRKTSAILAEQKQNIILNGTKFQMLLQMRAHAEILCKELAANRVDALGVLLDETWRMKRQLAGGISSSGMDAIYERALAAGALGGKLLGAGGGGFFLFYCPEEKQPSLRKALPEIRPVPFEFENHGTRIIFVED
jgi:D-glycero-alpha-D-manno-heptose-7-phosphate kinase